MSIDLPEGLTAYDLETLRLTEGHHANLDRAWSTGKLITRGLLESGTLRWTGAGRLVLALAERCQRAEAERDAVCRYAAMAVTIPEVPSTVRRIAVYTPEGILAQARRAAGLDKEATNAKG